MSMTTSVPINGASLNYLDQGTGPAILLLHGFPLNRTMWSAQIEALAPKCRVIAPDFRGFGQSGSSGPFTIESLADDIHTLIAQLKLDKIILAGLSMGGYVALAYASKYSSTLRALILLDTKAEADTPAGKEGRDKMIAQVKAQGAKPIADAMLGKLIPQDAITNRPKLAADLRAMMERTDPATIAHALAAMRDRPDRSSELSAIKVPTLLIVGEHDVITPPDVMQAMANQIPGSTLKIITASGHMSTMEQPTQVNAAITSFLHDFAARDLPAS